jgi:DNA invertase Pin-like site-specific DNA recombinase
MTLFAAELHILRARTRDNLIIQARRGELASRMPVGYRRLGDGTVVLDPEELVRQTITRTLERDWQLRTERFGVLRNARALRSMRKQYPIRPTVPSLRRSQSSAPTAW